MPFNFRERGDIEAVLELIKNPPKKEKLPRQGPAKREVVAPAMIFKTPAGGIPARSGVATGSADCTPYYIDSDGDLIEFTDFEGTTLTVTVYHIGASAVTGSAYIQAKRCHGRWVADMEDCG